ncbi:hypothetical protein RclHR1_03850005 [Rhizophagus clarus]|uniref:Uncharacterized protein n=1 Tax=Rhizophagus clarus TaxID=94130 RepID=A0A2Z6S7R8_9GLOM|nr:hypothetical protein RclHR1_03850005 [Rhizophagus clarus]GES74269.1 hypothetical protein GLOIN_2v1699196 [Rhizophagus clarus]
MIPSNKNNTTPAIYVDIIIGIVVIFIGAIIYIGRLLFKKRRRKRKNHVLEQPIIELEEIDIKPSPKKTAADHLEELKEATQKVLQPLRKSASFSSPKESLSLNLSNLSSGRSSTSSSRTKFDNNKTFLFKPFKVPLPPPPTPIRNDDIKAEPLRLSLLNLLLTKDSEDDISPIPSSSLVDSPKKISKSQPSLLLLPETHSKKNLKTALSQSDLNHPPKSNYLRTTLSHSDLKRPPESHLKKDILSSRLDSASPPKTVSSRIKPSMSTIPQLDLTIPSETHLTRTRLKSESKVHSKKSNRYTYSHDKETNDYTNFQPIQNIKPFRNTMSSTDKTGELTLSPMYNIMKPVLKKESQDDEIILDATLE